MHLSSVVFPLAFNKTSIASFVSGHFVSIFIPNKHSWARFLATMTLLTQFELLCSSRTTHSPIVETALSASQEYKLRDDIVRSDLIKEPPSSNVLLIWSKNRLLITVTSEPVSIIACVAYPFTDTSVVISLQSLFIKEATSVSCSGWFMSIVVAYILISILLLCTWLSWLSSLFKSLGLLIRC